MATWMIAARAATCTSNRISRQMASLSANRTSKLIQRRGLASSADHHVPPKVDLKQEAKAKKEANYILYTGLYFIHYYIYLAIIDYRSDEERDEKLVRYVDDDEVPS